MSKQLRYGPRTSLSETRRLSTTGMVGDPAQMYSVQLFPTASNTATAINIATCEPTLAQLTSRSPSRLYLQGVLPFSEMPLNDPHNQRCIKSGSLQLLEGPGMPLQQVRSH